MAYTQEQIRKMLQEEANKKDAQDAYSNTGTWDYLYDVYGYKKGNDYNANQKESIIKTFGGKQGASEFNNLVYGADGKRIEEPVGDSTNWDDTFRKYYNDYLNPRMDANSKAYENIISQLRDNANNEIDQNEINYRRNLRLLDERYANNGMANSGMANSEYLKAGLARDKANATTRANLNTNIATQEANKAQAIANLEGSASNYAQGILNKLRG